MEGLLLLGLLMEQVPGKQGFEDKRFGIYISILLCDLGQAA